MLLEIKVVLLFNTVHMLTYSCVTIWYQLFLEFWLIHTWIFAHWRHQRAVTSLENVRQLNERWGKKLDINLLHRQPSKQRYLLLESSIHLLLLLLSFLRQYRSENIFLEINLRIIFFRFAIQIDLLYY